MRFLTDLRGLFVFYGFYRRMGLPRRAAWRSAREVVGR